MYPLAEGQLYPRNQWYVAATTDEITRTPFERTILGDPVVFYRTQAGTPVALAGLCPHRLFPLAKSRLVGDRIECGYHGFTYNAQGRCTRVPTQSQIPERFATRRFPLIEKWNWVWIWPGDPQLADESRLPDLASIGICAPGWRADIAGYYHLDARYTLLIDNLLDLTHIAFTHAKSVPGWEYTLKSHAEIDDLPGLFRFRRHYSNVEMDDFSRMLHPDLDGLIDNGLVSEYFGPSLVNAGGPYVSKPGDTHIRKMNFIHAVTPETPHTTHYFMATARNFRIMDDELSQILSTSMKRVAYEDVETLVDVEKRIDQFADVARELSCQADAGAIRVRRMMSAQIAAERTP